jgi:hypothetical protein
VSAIRDEIRDRNALVYATCTQDLGSPTTIAKAFGYLHKYFEGSYFSGRLPSPSALVFPFTAVIDLHDMTVIDRDTDENNLMTVQDILDALDQANSH